VCVAQPGQSALSLIWKIAFVINNRKLRLFLRASSI